MKTSNHNFNHNSFKALKFDRTVRTKEKFDKILLDLFDPECELEPLYLDSTFYYFAAS